MSDNLQKMYDNFDEGTWNLFGGGFINFGYWELHGATSSISLDQRVESQKRLYRVLLNRLNITSTHDVLDVGCGTGIGSILAHLEFHPHHLVAIDANATQVQRSIERTKTNPMIVDQVTFEVGSAEKIPYERNAFDIVYSIEAAQHFRSFDEFALESYRVLRPNGMFGCATFFSTSHENSVFAGKLLKTVDQGVDKLIPVTCIESVLQEAKFFDVTIESIGEHVWLGFDRWIAQGSRKATWNRNWYKAYKQLMIDYYVVTARKKN